jgi:hypothetical protein
MERGGNYWKGDFFPGERKVTRKMSEYSPEDLYWKYVFTLLVGNKGRIEKVSKKEAVLWNGERIKRAAWPLYIIMDEEFREGETVRASLDSEECAISEGKTYEILKEFQRNLGSMGEYHILKIRCDDGEIREIDCDYFEKIRSERDKSWFARNGKL